MSGTTWTKFYWSDYANDAKLKMCSLAAQGLWMRMMCIAAEGDSVGFLSLNGNALTADDIGSAIGRPGDECRELIAELEKWGVFSRARGGVIYIRRMVLDEKKAKTARENGKKGGNPTIGKLKENSSLVNPPVNTHIPDTNNHSNPVVPLRDENDLKSPIDLFDNLEPVEKPKPSRKTKPDPEAYTPEFEAAWQAYPHNHGRRDKRAAFAEWSKLSENDRLALAGAIPSFAATEQATKDNRQYVKGFERWIARNLWRGFVIQNVVELKPEIDWNRRCIAHIEKDMWLHHWGNEPGYPGCDCPKDILATHGLLNGRKALITQRRIENEQRLQS